VIASETNDGTRLNEARVKALTGCDPITARFLHGEFFTFEPAAKFWLSVNHKPVVRDDSYGFWRRIRLIPFTRRFPTNASLADDLLAEGPGILRWAVQGTVAWRAYGLTPPAVVADATTAYERDSDALAAFIDEACILHPEAETKAHELFCHYQAWADRSGLAKTGPERLTATAFGRRMGTRFSRLARSTGNVYRGIGKRAL
jgi:putative DNA primase/helicase